MIKLNGKRETERERDREMGMRIKTGLVSLENPN
jgi:hypothetical protein